MKLQSFRVRRNVISLIVMTLLFLMTTGIDSYAYNNTWSAQAIGNFIYNKVDAPNIFKNEKYTEDITREEFAELIVAVYSVASKIDKNNIPLKENPFKDTNSMDVQRAFSLGIVSGTSKDTYSPKDKITREEIATVITRFLNIQGIATKADSNALNNFEDGKDVSLWALHSMAYCVEQEIMKGYLNTGRIKDGIPEIKLNPKAYATVEQAIVILDHVALKHNWIIPSKDKYINGFFVPHDTKIYCSGYLDGLFINIIWEKIDDTEKLRNDLFYILNQIIKNKEELDSLIEYAVNTREDSYKRLKIEGWNVNIGTGARSTYIQIYK